MKSSAAAAVALVAVAPGAAVAHAQRCPAERALLRRTARRAPTSQLRLELSRRRGPVSPRPHPEHDPRRRDLSGRGFRSGVRWYHDVFTPPPAAGATGWVLRFDSVDRRTDILAQRTPARPPRRRVPRLELPATSIRPATRRADGPGRRAVSRSALPAAGRPAGWWNCPAASSRGLPAAADDLRRPRPAGRRDTGLARARARGCAGGRHGGRPRAALVHARSSAAGRLRDSGLRRSRERRAGRERPIAAGPSIHGARVWEPGRPTLYAARLTLTGGQETTATSGCGAGASRAGARYFDGRPLDLRRASLAAATAHGAALTAADRRRLSVADIARRDLHRARYPLHPALLEAFDRLGIDRLGPGPGVAAERARARRPAGHPGTTTPSTRWSPRPRPRSVIRRASPTRRCAAARPRRGTCTRRPALVRRLDATRLVAADARCAR